jgi:alpha-ketoglutarate-dependent 2,4-dichlorophenoxyacetate dioxygenase
MAVKITTLEPGFAARIEGLDAANPTDADIAAFKAAMVQHAVAVLPGQDLSPDAQVAFAERFGPLDSNPYAQRSYNTGLRQDLLSISNADGEAPADVMDRRRMLDLGNKLWHSDSSFKAVPAHYSMLYAIRLPAEGGDTQFADLRAGYDDLTPEMKRLIEGLVAEHSVMHSRRMLGFDDWFPEQREAMGGYVAHDLVRTLPESGRKTLYLSAHASHIVGLPVPIGRMLLHELTEAATTPDKVYSHRWTEGDLVIWDNRCTLHRLRRYRASDEVRELRRVTTLAPEFPARDPTTVTVAPWVIEQAA